MIKRALITSFIVGPCLILINQWDALFDEAAFKWLSAALTFLVPFMVSLTSSYLTQRNAKKAL